MPRNSHKYLAGNFVEEIQIDFLFRKVTLEIERTWEIERILTFQIQILLGCFCFETSGRLVTLYVSVLFREKSQFLAFFEMISIFAPKNIRTEDFNPKTIFILDHKRH